MKVQDFENIKNTWRIIWSQQEGKEEDTPRVNIYLQQAVK